MNRAVLLAALGAIALLANPILAQKKASEGDAVKNGWLFSLSQGKAQAEKTGKPMMVVMRCVP